MKPYGFNLMIMPYRPKSNSPILTKEDKQKTDLGIVLDVGQSVTKFKKKDQVVFNRHRASSVNYKDEEIYFVPEEDIYARFET